jgi:hypothetical protein
MVTSAAAAEQVFDTTDLDDMETSILAGVELCKKLRAKIDELLAEISRLEAAGMANGSIHMRDGKYAYLVHSQKGKGKRVREYIGTDQEKIELAKAKIDRYRQWSICHQTLAKIKAEIIDLRWVTRSLERANRRW